ncbi:MAG TPA: M48 family metalloprotease [Streptosporangiaceae bacterium]|nr:M48 family metalloprotease [Streptosporangiaceae bacterium]
MHVAVYLPLLVPVLAAFAARPLAERLPPRTAAWLLAGSAVVLAGASGAVLGLLALAAAVRLPPVDATGGLSLPVILREDPASLPVGAAAAALLAAGTVAAGRAAWLRAGALLAAHRQARRLPGGGQLVVLADDAADAYAAPGWPGRIVVTSGMLGALSHDERQVLLAHERAHAAGCHYLFTAAARLAAAANPLLRPVAAAVGYSVERWADERAAAAAGNRALAARTIAKAALAASAAPPRRPAPAAALAAVPGPLRTRGAGPVPRRVAALLRPAPRPRLLLLGAAVTLVAVSGLAAVEAATDLHGLIEFAQASAAVAAPR